MASNFLVKEEFDSLDKIDSYLRSSKSVVSGTLNIDKFLNTDLSINLELLDIAVKYCVENFGKVELSGEDRYRALRGISMLSSNWKEEREFILQYCTALAIEYSTSEEVLVQYGY